MSANQSSALIPEQTPSPRGPIVRAKRRARALPWTIVGMALGIGGTILWQSTGAPPPRFNAVHASANPSPTESSTPIPTPSATPTPAAPPTPSAAPVEPSPLDTVNFLPPILGGPEVVETPSVAKIPAPPSIQGNLPNLPSVGPMLGGTRPVQPTFEATSPVEVGLVTMTLSGGESEVDSTESKLTALAKKLGGSAISYSELAEKQEADRSAMLLVVPSDKRETATAQLRKLGASVDENWQGGASDRAALLEDRLGQAIRNLQRDREKLIVKYFEDAEPVKEIDERIAFATKQLRAVSIGNAPKSALLRVYVGPNG